MNDCIVMQNVSKDYGKFRLKDVSLTVPQGSIVGLIGENGAGKTTLIRLLLNLCRRDSGSISVFGLDNIADERRIKEQVGVVFDECAFARILTARDVDQILGNICPQWDSGDFFSRIKSWGIEPEKRIRDYSRGMKMKLSIAAAMARRPRLLILDEATSGLDPVMRGEVLDAFQEFIEEPDHAILLSSHITSDLDRIADYIVFLHEGKVLLKEDKDTLLYRYGVARCPEEALSRIPAELVCGMRRGRFGCEVLVQDADRLRRVCPEMVVDRVDLEQIMTLMIRRDAL